MARKYKYIVEREGTKGWEIVSEGTQVQPALSMMRDWAGEGYAMRLTQIPDKKIDPEDGWKKWTELTDLEHQQIYEDYKHISPGRYKWKIVDGGWKYRDL